MWFPSPRYQHHLNTTCLSPWVLHIDGGVTREQPASRSSSSNTGRQDKSRCSFSSPLPLHWSVPCVTVLVCSKSIRLATTAAAAAANRAESRPMNVRNHPLLLVCYNGAAWGRTNLIKRARLWNWARAATLLRLLLAQLFFVKGCSFILGILFAIFRVGWLDVIER